MFCFMTFCEVVFLHTVLIHCSGNYTVIQFSVPKDHHICLQCGGSDSSDVIWTHQDRKVLVSRQGRYETNKDHQRYQLVSDGGLCLLRLDDSDGGKFECNQQLVAELQLLTGQDFRVSAGRTLLLPCSNSSKVKKKWFHRRGGGRWEAILTQFRNGTVKPKRSRLSLGNDALQIQDLQPEDTGEYLCNGVPQARLTILTVQPETTSFHPTTSTTATAAVMDTDEVDIKKRPENVLLMLAVVGFGLMILLMAVVCVLLTIMKCRRNKKHRCAGSSDIDRGEPFQIMSNQLDLLQVDSNQAQMQEDTELQPWKKSNTQTECEVYESPSLAEETIHYASLGRQNWRERPSRTPPDQSDHNVIYSSVITGPAAKQKRPLLHPAL